MAKPPIHATTQNFIEVEDIVDQVIFLKGRNACSLLEVSSVNFFLLSQDEQNARIYGYMSFLNSLSSSLQIIIISKKIDLTNYVKMLEEKITTVTNARLSEHLSMYRDFIIELVKGGELLDKKLYVVIPFNSLELGPVTAAGGGAKKQVDIKQRMVEALASKRENVMAQIQRIGLNARVLEREELAKLLFEIFNQESISLDYNSGDVKNIIL